MYMCSIRMCINTYTHVICIYVWIYIHTHANTHIILFIVFLSSVACRRLVNTDFFCFCLLLYPFTCYTVTLCLIEISNRKSPSEDFPLSLKIRLVYLNYILDSNHLQHPFASSPNLLLSPSHIVLRGLSKCGVRTWQWQPDLKYGS